MGREERVEGLISTANPGSGVDNASSRVDGLTLGALVCGRLLLADDALLPVLQYNFSRVVDGAPQLSDSQCVPPRGLLLQKVSNKLANSEFFRPLSQPTGPFVNTSTHRDGLKPRRHDCDHTGNCAVDDNSLYLTLRHRPRIPADGASFAPPAEEQSAEQSRPEPIPFPFPTVAASHHPPVPRTPSLSRPRRPAQPTPLPPPS